MTPAGANRRGEPALGRLLVVPTSSNVATSSDAPWGACVEALQAAGHLVHTAATAAEAVAAASAGDHEIAVLVAPAHAAERGLDKAGRELLSRMALLLPVVVAGVAEPAAARALSHAGAYLTVPGCDLQALEPVIAQALHYARAVDREARFDPSERDLERMLGAGDAMASVVRLVERAAGVSAPALVTGEVGSGKHVVARSIHAHPRSPRRQGPFVKCPLGTLDEDAVREELFGTSVRPGVLELAHGGTLYLEDVAILSSAMQSMLLDLMAAGRDAVITPVDSSTKISADVRLVAGSTQDIHDDAAHGGMRSDFYERIGVLAIRLPPLRERQEDIPALAGAILDRFAKIHHRAIVGLTPAAASLMQRYGWPGNIRELEEHIERAVRRTHGPAIDVTDLPDLAHRAAGRPDAPAPVMLDLHLALDPGLPLSESGRRARMAAEVLAIRRALKLEDGNVTHAARRLGISRVHLQQRMKLYGLRPK
ncbi:MAG: sigma 54-interacting transcriptional regulator [Candidatus Polarisedimenticolia bacterium]